MIVVKRMQAAPRVIRAGGMLHVSFATFGARVDPSKVKRAASRPFCRRGPEAVVEVGGKLGYEPGRKAPNPYWW